MLGVCKYTFRITKLRLMSFIWPIWGFYIWAPTMCASGRTVRSPVWISCVSLKYGYVGWVRPIMGEWEMLEYGSGSPMKAWPNPTKRSKRENIVKKLVNKLIFYSIFFLNITLQKVTFCWNRRYIETKKLFFSPSPLKLTSSGFQLVNETWR